MGTMIRAPMKFIYPTPTETKICELALQDMSIKEIAYALNVSENTIKTERQRLMKKAGVKSFHKLLSLFEANMSLKMSLKRMTDGDRKNSVGRKRPV